MTSPSSGLLLSYIFSGTILPEIVEQQLPYLISGMKWMSPVELQWFFDFNFFSDYKMPSSNLSLSWKHSWCFPFLNLLKEECSQLWASKISHFINIKFKGVCFPVCTSLWSKGKTQDFKNTKEAPMIKAGKPTKMIPAGNREEFWWIAIRVILITKKIYFCNDGRHTKLHPALLLFSVIRCSKIQALKGSTTCIWTRNHKHLHLISGSTQNSSVEVHQMWKEVHWRRLAEAGRGPLGSSPGSGD